MTTPSGYYQFEWSGEEISALLQKAGSAAPGGFGFGERLTEIKAESAGESYETFCAKIDAFAADMPDNTAALVLAYPPAIYDFARLSLTVLAKGSNDYIALRNLAWGNVQGFSWQMIRARYPSSQSPSVWLPFEWLNPPLQIGVEYRTVESYLGKPVYAKAISLGALPNNSQKLVNHGVENMDYCLSLTGTASNYNILGFNGVASIFCGITAISVETNSDQTSRAGIAVIHYTKSTD